MSNQVLALCALLRASGGNWRNAVWIECDFCPYGRTLCTGYLLTIDRDGNPITFSADRFRQLTEEAPQKEECVAVLKRSAFETLYSVWLTWKIDNPWECSLLQLEKNKSL